MALHIYNTLTGKKQALTPQLSGKIHMYVCGPTVYDYSHIGHARSAVTFDVIARYLRAKGYELTYVRNLTDVDDKIVQKARDSNADYRQVSERFIRAFHNDMDLLNVKRPDYEPRVTEYIEPIISFISRLVGKGYAYQVEGDVIYSARSFSDYGRLSGRSFADMAAGFRVPIDQRKRDLFDFSLWKAVEPEEPGWHSPWGRGRPGWHIECSTLCKELLGETIDIHGGGKDLIFPHHENEIAQSEAAHDKQLATYWIHNDLIKVNREKMSKTLGNAMRLRDLFALYHPEAIRLYLLQRHYRRPIEFSRHHLDAAAAGLDRLYSFLQRVENLVGQVESEIPKTRPNWERFCRAMDDDFNTAAAMAVLYGEVRRVNRELNSAKGNFTGETGEKLRCAAADFVRTAQQVLGILAERPNDYFEKRTESLKKKVIEDVPFIEKLIAERLKARREKDWRRADEIWLQLKKMNIRIEDKGGKTLWKLVH